MDESIVLRGRDHTARAIDTLLTAAQISAMKGQTASGIVVPLASSLGYAPDVVSTSTVYNNDNLFCEGASVWDCIVELAKREGFRAWVSPDLVLHFAPYRWTAEPTRQYRVGLPGTAARNGLLTLFTIVLDNLEITAHSRLEVTREAAFAADEYTLTIPNTADKYTDLFYQTAGNSIEIKASAGFNSSTIFSGVLDTIDFTYAPTGLMSLEFHRDVGLSLGLKVMVIGYDPKTKKGHKAESQTNPLVPSQAKTTNPLLPTPDHSGGRTESGPQPGEISYTAESRLHNRAGFQLITVRDYSLDTKAKCVARAEALLTDWSKDLVTGNLRSPLDLELQPDDLIRITGNRLADLTGGRYYVTKVAHKSDTEGQETSIDFASRVTATPETTTGDI